MLRYGFGERGPDNARSACMKHNSPCALALTAGKKTLASHPKGEIFGFLGSNGCGNHH